MFSPGGYKDPSFTNSHGKVCFAQIMIFSPSQNDANDVKKSLLNYNCTSLNFYEDIDGFINRTCKNGFLSLYSPQPLSSVH